MSGEDRSLELRGAELRRLIDEAARRVVAHVDSLPRQPSADTAGGQALARSFARRPEVRTLDLAGSGPASARSYDHTGRLVAVVTSAGGSLRVPVAPGGFSVASR